jgi:hypothetical protein
VRAVVATTYYATNPKSRVLLKERERDSVQTGGTKD